MKRHFGTFWTRSFLGSGTKLSVVEHRLIEELISALPDWLRTTVEAQFESYNLAQREVNGRELNFYRKVGGRANCMDGLPLLSMNGDEAPLMRITAQLAEEPECVHATLNAVGGRAFCVGFSRRVDRYADGTKVAVIGITEAWRSNFPRPKALGEQIGSSNGG
jgi:hypothetical protein